ncbi:MAG TPA: sigma 54-interacting transcriptional regulator [Clostridiales bacterium]|nr:sigma 54-interacting transcriptional regulator [Clostridiales bacterium]
MFKLSNIQSTAIQVAEAITAAIGLETEIIDEDLKIIAGTGRYKRKVGQFEEDGDLESGFIYGRLLKTGEEYIIDDPTPDPPYGAKEGEMAEICCPIRFEQKIVGLIALVAFDVQQKKMLLEQKEKFLNFLKRMADLLASKLAEVKHSNELTAILEAIHDGIIAVDQQGIIVSCNQRCERLLSLKRSELIGKSIRDVFAGCPIEEVIQTGIPCQDKEEIYSDGRGNSMRFLSTIMPIYTNQGFQADEKKVTGAVISFQDISDVRSRIYQMTQKQKRTSFDDIIGNSPAIMQIKERALQIASSQSTVLITGESGTGKELLARAIHDESPRKTESFIAINCGAIPETLLESELFGYESGAFTGASRSGKAGKFELANKGTIFLDEIGDLPLHLQGKLLHVLQRRQVERIGSNHPISIDVRVIAATNKDLEQMIKNKEFREDLYFRLNVIPIHIPALRERREDIVLLLEYALKKFNQRIHKNIRGFTEEAFQRLYHYHWPGNVRELENVVEYAVNVAQGEYIDVESLPERIQKFGEGIQVTDWQSLKYQTNLFQKRLIEDCLRQTGYSLEGKCKAAQMLKISESTLYRKLKELGIQPGTKDYIK